MIVQLIPGELSHPMYLSDGFQIGSHPFQVRYILVVHADNQIEVMEVSLTYRTGDRIQHISPTGRMRPHP